MRTQLTILLDAEWALVDAACTAYSVVTVPLYDTLGPEAVRYICGHAELAGVACSVDVLPTLLQTLPDCPTVTLVVCYPAQSRCDCALTARQLQAHVITQYAPAPSPGMQPLTAPSTGMLWSQLSWKSLCLLQGHCGGCTQCMSDVCRDVRGSHAAIHKTHRGAEGLKWSGSFRTCLQLGLSARMTSLSLAACCASRRASELAMILVFF